MELTKFHSFHSFKVFLFGLCVIILFPELVVCRTRHYTFNVQYYLTHACNIKFTSILSLHFYLIFILCIFFFMNKIEYKNVTRLCHTRTILTVNGKFPGPRLVAREGDRVLVKVVNHISNNVTIHWYVYMHVLSFILQSTTII